MNEIEKKARELLAAQWQGVNPVYAMHIRGGAGMEQIAVRALVDALSVQPAIDPEWHSVVCDFVGPSALAYMRRKFDAAKLEAGA